MTQEPKDKLFTKSFIFACIGNFLLFMGFYMLLPILPLYLIDTFHSSKSEVGLILSCYTVAALAVRPFSGFLADKFDRKPIYLLAYAFFIVIFISYPLVEFVFLFTLMRVLHGLAFGVVTTAGNTLIVDIMPSSRRGEGLGYFGVANNLAMAVGPMIGLMLHEATASYDLIFYSAVLSGVIGFFFASQIRVPKKQKFVCEPISLDRFFLIKGLKAGFCLLILAIPYGITTSYVALYAREIHVVGSLGLFFSLMAVGMIVSRTFSGTMVDKGKIPQVITYGSLVAMFAFLLFSSLGPISANHICLASVLFFVGALLFGVGYGMLFPAYNTLFVNLASNNRRATASSTYLTSWDVGIGIGLVMGGNMAELSGFPMTYFVGAVLVALSVVYFATVVTPHFNRYRLR
ncbi:MAG: MFS transporter [Bacteroidales bacterium]|nr:MFS transporter [Bacteroidales bacterium]